MDDLKKLTTKELLELAKTTIKEKPNQKVKRHVSEFIKDYQIIPGNTPVPTYVIYYEYRDIWRPTSVTKLSKVEFFRNFNQLFEQKRKTKKRYYLLNETPFDVSEEHMKFAQNMEKMYDRRKKNKSKKKCKIPKSKKGVHVKTST